MKILLIILSLLVLSNCGVIRYVKKKNNPAPISNHLKLEAADAHKNQDYQRAGKLYQDLFAAQNDQQDLLFAADNYRLANECTKAINLYRQVVASNLYQNQAKEGLSLCLLQNGAYEEAVKLFKETTEVDATRWKTINGFAIIFALNKHYKEALNYFDIALEFSDEKYVINNNKALTLALAGRAVEGIALLKQVSETLIDKKNVKEKIEMNLALLYGINSQFAEAKAICKQYLSEDKVYGNLSFYATLANNKKLSADYLKKALQ
jgi:Flp pilus assembly protein TadD